MHTLFSLLIEMLNIPAMVRNLFRHREVIRVLTWRDFGTRFRGSIGGVIWPIAQPLLMMIIYTLVFSTFLKVRFGVDDSPFNFSVYLLCGLLPWNNFSEGLSLSSNLIRTNQNLVKRIVFPLEVLPINLTMVATIQQMIGLLILLPLAVMVSGKVAASIALLPVVLLFQVIFLIGINWLWTSLSVFIPDLRQFTSLLLTLLMFITPLFYPESVIPARAQFIVKFNPMARLIQTYRSILIDGILPGSLELVGTAASCIIFFLLGYVFFMHTKKHFADFL